MQELFVLLFYWVGFVIDCTKEISPASYIFTFFFMVCLFLLISFSAFIHTYILKFVLPSYYQVHPLKWSEVKWKSLSCIWLFVTHGLYSPWNSLDLNTGVGNHFLLQGIFPTQGSNPGLPHCRQIPYQLSQQGSLKCTIQ